MRGNASRQLLRRKNRVKQTPEIQSSDIDDVRTRSHSSFCLCHSEKPRDFRERLRICLIQRNRRHVKVLNGRVTEIARWDTKLLTRDCERIFVGKRAAEAERKEGEAEAEEKCNLEDNLSLRVSDSESKTSPKTIQNFKKFSRRGGAGGEHTG